MTVLKLLLMDQGNRTTPSYVAFTPTERLIGDAAKNQYAMNPNNTVFDIKRLIGRMYNDEKLQQDLKHLTYNVVSKDNKPMISVDYMNENKKVLHLKKLVYDSYKNEIYI